MLRAAAVLLPLAALPAQAAQVSSAEVRSIFAARCFVCHGSDANKRKGGPEGGDGLRLDTRAGQRVDLGGHAAVVPGDAAASELLRRVTATGRDRMPPVGKGAALAADEVALLRRWVEQGARWDEHWSMVPPRRPPLPAVRDAAWSRNEVDRFVLARLEASHLTPSAEADRYTLIRRLSLDLCGLPPAPEEAAAFAADRDPGAYGRLVDRLLASPAYGERWAQPWLDLARYADSAGYADDPPRTIWAWRDWVVKALNDNMPFDRFTVEQLAGDLLPQPTEAQRVATAFHRNTMTNSEGGTDDEEFRCAAVVDRVNTTMAVWMASTVGCAQCHTHKYDPITQHEFYRLFAIFNNTEDADRRNEAPVLELYSEGQRERHVQWEAEIAQLEREMRADAPEVVALRQAWDRRFPRAVQWQPAAVEVAEGAARVRAFPAAVTALRVELPGAEGTPQWQARLVDPRQAVARGRFVRVTQPGKGKVLHLAEVQVLRGADNLALRGTARQVSTAYDGPARLAIDGNTDGDFARKSTTHTATADDPWWEIDLGAEREVDRVIVWNRTDSERIRKRLQGFRVELLDAARRPVWTRRVGPSPKPKVELQPLPGGPQVAVRTSYRAPDGAFVLLLAAASPAVDGAALELRATVGRRAVVPRAVSITTAPDLERYGGVPSKLLEVLAVPAAARTAAQRRVLEAEFPGQAAELAGRRVRIASLRGKLERDKPRTTVPVQRELPEGKRRKTHVHIRGSFLQKGDEVQPGVPQCFRAPGAADPADRLALARWLVSADNPRTARVVVNRFFEQLFGTGLVATSEDFGVQGERPSHPGLLDWLAVQFVEGGWDVKALLRTLVTSATYRQASSATPDLLRRDPDNRLLARGPRVRLSAEMVRDQALAIAGLLSRKMYGPPVRPPRPNLGLKAAFGGSTDWSTSAGEDRYRRGLYTTWRRSLPYPSMVTFDAPSREVCTVTRSRTNTPLQALVTLNDPVYVEAAQALARRIVAEGGADLRARAAFGLRLCVLRPVQDAEVDRVVALFEQAKARYDAAPDDARAMATDPLGPAPAGADVAALAAWSVVSNVLLNLDALLQRM